MPAQEKPTGDYVIGYARPPQHTKWPKGKSGNPKGRPKKQRGDILAILDAPVSIKSTGKLRSVSTFEAGFRRLAQKAIGGDTRAIIKFIRMCEEHKVIDPPSVIDGGGVVVAPPGVNFHEWLESVTEEIPDVEE